MIARWDGEQVVVHYDMPTGTWMFVCMHSTRLGPAAGGTRMRVYGSPHEALEDGLRLAAGMTRKNAVAGLPLGGGKAVLAVSELPDARRRRQAIERYAEMVASLGGSFVTGPDMNTSDADMDMIRARCPYAYGTSLAAGGSGSSGPSTAVGVFHGIRAALAHVFGAPELAGRTVLVQGVGGVGATLAELLARDGATLLVSDVARDRAVHVAERHGGRVVSAEDVPDTECDVYAPCAIGGVVSANTVPRLRCRIVAGAANNQLDEPGTARLLRDRGILYAPDYVMNAGGALQLVALEIEGWSRERLDERLAAIGDVLATIFRQADAEGITPEEAAERLARERLARAASSS